MGCHWQGRCPVACALTRVLVSSGCLIAEQCRLAWWSKVVHSCKRRCVTIELFRRCPSYKAYAACNNPTDANPKHLSLSLDAISLSHSARMNCPTIMFPGYAIQRPKQSNCLSYCWNSRRLSTLSYPFLHQELNLGLYCLLLFQTVSLRTADPPICLTPARYLALHEPAF